MHTARYAVNLPYDRAKTHGITGTGISLGFCIVEACDPAKGRSDKS